MVSIAEAVPKAAGPSAEWRRKYVYTRNDKDIVLYAGLLDLAHEQAGGRLHLATTLVQIPGPENGHVAICTAEAKIVDPGGITLRSTSGIGDADPDNAGPIAKKALLRLAETRAKARALRDLVNVGEALDEADDDPREPEGGELATTHGKRSDNGQTKAAPRGPVVADDTDELDAELDQVAGVPDVPNTASGRRFKQIYVEAMQANVQRLPIMAPDARDADYDDEGRKLYRRLPAPAQDRLKVLWDNERQGAAR